MTRVDAHAWLEHLSPVECWRLLAAKPVGRLGVLVDSAPEVYPVNHVVDGASIVFRTDPGTKLRALDRSPSVCFEIDEVDPDTSTGWSVMLKGRATEITDLDELRAAADLPLRFWIQGDKDHWIRVVAEEVTGRRIVVSRERPTLDTAVVAVEEVLVEVRGYL
jgi:hypothetical protein